MLPAMGKGQVEIDIDRPADQVWAVVADFGGLASWFPGMESCTLEGDVRTIKMMGMQIAEQLKGKDDTARQLSYSIVSGVPVDHHLVTITVNPAGETSHVTWAYEIEPEAMTDLIADTYKGAVEALKKRCET